MTTSTDDLKLAEVSELLAEMQATNQELTLEVDKLTATPPAPTIHWQSLAIGLLIGAGVVALAFGLS